MEVEQLAIPKKRAEEEYEALKQVFKTHHAFRSQDQIYKDMQKVYGHLKHGKKIIDIYQAFKHVGLNEEGDPKLAIVRADAQHCFCKKFEDGGARFSLEDTQSWHASKHPIKNGDIKFPEKTFTWVRVASPTQWDSNHTIIKHEHIKTIVPVIPPHILIDEVKYLLPNYNLLWEVEEWKPVPPKDPILLKQLTPNLFGVLATWNLTKLEQAIIRGRIS